MKYMVKVEAHYSQWVEVEATTPKEAKNIIKLGLPRGTILLMKIGHFYEAFGEDAQTMAGILDKPSSYRNDVPMCGFPADTIDTMLAKMVRVGKSVALAERFEDGRFEVVRVIIP